MILYKLIVTLPEARNGWWDGGKKQVFEFTPTPCGKRIFPEIDNSFQPKSWYKWGSFGANFWFTCLSGVSPKSAVQYAKMRLKSFCKVPGTKIEIEERVIG